jgi:hypothetical protein
MRYQSSLQKPSPQQAPSHAEEVYDDVKKTVSLKRTPSQVLEEFMEQTIFREVMSDEVPTTTL